MADYIEVDGRKIEVDEDGFIQEPDKWDEACARVLALTEGVEEMNRRALAPCQLSA